MPLFKKEKKMHVVSGDFRPGKELKPRTTRVLKEKVKNRKNKTLRLQYGSVKNEQTSRLKWLMVVLCIVMVAIVGMIVYFLIGELSSDGEAVSSNETSSAAESAEELLPVDSKELTLVNLKNELPEDYQYEETQVSGISCDVLAAEPLRQLLDAAEQAGLRLVVIQGYVDAQTQQEYYEQTVTELMESQGYTRLRAEGEAEDITAPAGKSEFQTGLAFLLSKEELQEGEDFSSTAEYEWLRRNCVDYGFVLRYPNNKTGSTGRSFSPSQFRYVGKEHAVRMRMLDMSLEEYVEYLNEQ